MLLIMFDKRIRQYNVTIFNFFCFHYNSLFTAYRDNMREKKKEKRKGKKSTWQKSIKESHDI